MYGQVDKRHIGVLTNAAIDSNSVSAILFFLDGLLIGGFCLG